MLAWFLALIYFLLFYRYFYLCVWKWHLSILPWNFKDITYSRLFSSTHQTTPLATHTAEKKHTWRGLDFDSQAWMFIEKARTKIIISRSVLYLLSVDKQKAEIQIWEAYSSNQKALVGSCSQGLFLPLPLENSDSSTWLHCANTTGCAHLELPLSLYSPCGKIP